jgi:sulfate transport system permease protein
MLIVSKLEQNSYAEATAIALVLLAMSLGMLAIINVLQSRSRRHYA